MFLFQTHFVCVVPPYRTPSITEPVPVRLCVVSSGKTSEYHQFVYTPVNGTVSGKHIKCIIATSFPEDGLISGFDRFSSPKFDLRPIGTRRCDMLFIGYEPPQPYTVCRGQWSGLVVRKNCMQFVVNFVRTVTISMQLLLTSVYLLWAKQSYVAEPSKFEVCGFGVGANLSL